MIKKLCLALTLLVSFGLGTSGCGSSFDINGSYKVQDVNILADDIFVGESVRTEIFFETESEIDGAADGVQVVVNVSRHLRYIPGTSEIYDDSTDESDPRSPDAVIPCPDGSTFLFYNFLDSDLEDRSIAGFSNFGFRFEVVGSTRTSSAIISASAAEDEDFSCFSDFDGEEDESVEVK